MKRRGMLRSAIVGFLICATAVFATEGPAIKGNPKSKVYHKADCHHYTAKGSTASFNSESAAVKAGYTPCKQCGSEKKEKKKTGEK